MRGMIVRVVFALAVFAGTSVVRGQGYWQFEQLTHNDYEEINATIGGGAIAWSASDGNDQEVFHYDGNTITQVTNNAVFDSQVSVDGPVVAWQHYDGSTYQRVYMYDGQNTTQMSFGNASTGGPIAVEGNKLAWNTFVSGNSQVYYYDGAQTICLGPGSGPSMDDGLVAWQGAGASSIYLYDGNTTRTLITGGINNSPMIDQGRVVWYGQPSGGGTNILYLWDGNSTINLLEGEHPFYTPRISGSNIAWYADDGGGDYEVFLYDGQQVIQITDNDADDRSVDISGDRVVWSESGGNCFLYDDGQVIELLCPQDYGYWPDIEGDTVVWTARPQAGPEGTDFEIFVGHYVPEPATQSLLLALGGFGLFMRKLR